MCRISVTAEGRPPWRDVVEVSAGRETLVESVLSSPTSELTVTSNVTGAVVRVDGEAVGFTPTLLSDLSVGAHEVALEQTGLQPVSVEVELTAETRGWLTATLEPPAQTSRSDGVWLVGGVGIAALVAGAAIGGWALVTRDQFEEARAGGGADPASLREQGLGLSIATDALLGAGLLALVVATVLYFVTEETDERESRAVFSLDLQ